jgi:hypothetical protein
VVEDVVVLDVVVVGGCVAVVEDVVVLDVVVVGGTVVVVEDVVVLDVVVVGGCVVVVEDVVVLEVVVGGCVAVVEDVVVLDVVVVGACVVEVVVGGGAVVVVAPQTPAGHASQQLTAEPTHAVPPDDATQSLGRATTPHAPPPLPSVVQQVTYPGRPQVELPSQSMTSSRQSRVRFPLRTSSRAMREAHFTYSPCPLAPAQSQAAAISARVLAMAASSPHAPRATGASEREVVRVRRPVIR